MLPQDIIAGLILNVLTKDFTGFVRNYNMHNTEKTIGELHVMFIEYEKGLPKKAETPQVMMIKGGKIQKPNKKSLKAKGKGKANGKGNDTQVYIPKPKNPKPAAKEHPTKDDTCHYCKEGFREARKLKQGSLYFTKRAKHNLDSAYLWHCRLAHISKKRIEKLKQEGLLKLIDDESFDQCVSCLSGKMTRKSFPHRLERATDLLKIIHTDVCGPLRHVSRQCASYFITFTDDYTCYGYVYLLKHKHEVFETFKGCEALVKRDTLDKLQQRSVKCIFIGYPKETMGYYFYFPPENKIVVTRYAEFFEKNLITQEVSGGGGIDLEEIQDNDTLPSKITSKIPMEVEGFEPPQEEVILIRRSERTHQAPNHLCLNVEVDELGLGDLNEPASYKAAMLDSESNKWINAMNAEIQSMIDNMVWVLVDLPSGCKTVGSKWIFKKKTDMDGIVHTYKARLVAKGYTQLYEVDYEETFSPVANSRAIRILISIMPFYDYEIWKIDVKTAFLNGYLDQDIYMVQPKGFVNPNHPKKLCKLQRSIYGLKQASRSWNKRFDEEIKKFGFAQNLNEPCVYQKASGSNVTFLILYLDALDLMLRSRKILQAVSNRVLLNFELIAIAMMDLRPIEMIQNLRHEAEYIAASKAVMEAIWIRKFISGLGIVPTINEPIRMFCDNSNALHFSNEPGVQKGARHYHRRYHYVRESIALGEMIP
uniref:Retrotransposon protein, putative, Ty1-copia subclass n=1 Tax=Tanacetum cinerariifolium TaxID=118510 RepID=A0A6L2LAM8_TANCI|nr:retrotransposon protein, putative, Ty1-copia subclass [Tanacetum cinerariifolium]